MELREAIYKRRSIRSYSDKPVSREDIVEILEAGIMAPSAVNLQPWYFAVVESKEGREKLLNVMGEVSRKIQPELNARFAKHPEVVKETTRFVSLLGNAPVSILAFWYEKSYPQNESAISQSVSAAIENMLLSATDKGIGSCWLTAPLEAEKSEYLREKFAPEHGRMVAMITLGYPLHSQQIVPKRKEGRYTFI